MFNLFLTDSRLVAVRTKKKTIRQDVLIATGLPADKQAIPLLYRYQPDLCVRDGVHYGTGHPEDSHFTGCFR